MPCEFRHERTRLAGYASNELVFRQFKEGDCLITRHGGESFKKVIKGMPVLDMIEQGLDRNARSRKARDSTHALRIKPNNLIETNGRRNHLIQDTSDSLEVEPSLRERRW